MNQNPISPFKEWPFFVRLSATLLSIILIGFILTYFSMLVTPLFISILLSILLLPLTRFLERIRFPRSMAALTAVLFTLFVFVGLLYLLSSQIIAFTNDYDSIKKNILEHYDHLQQWLKSQFGISLKTQSQFLNDATANIRGQGAGYIKKTVTTLTDTLLLIIFIIIYTFLILYYRKLIRNFLFALFTKEHEQKVYEVLNESKLVVKSYMTGLVIEMGIVSLANTIVLMLCGVEYAVFLGLLTGILNIIPFIGIYSGIAITFLITLTTDASTAQIAWVVGGLVIVHFIDANFLMPRIVGSKVKINALITILGAVIGGTLMGIPGVFFALPTIAMLKIIFERIPDLQPWGMLFGDEVYTSNSFTSRLKRRLNIKNIELKESEKSKT
ncbi:MAG: AI-2E family transporter [Niastella sp.]|nr:AI-2E family transporter [Niastella sp.]